MSQIINLELCHTSPATPTLVGVLLDIQPQCKVDKIARMSVGRKKQYNPAARLAQVSKAKIIESGCESE